MKRFLRSRMTVLSLLGLFLLSLLLSIVIPQRFSLSSAVLQTWRQGHPLLVRVADLAGFDHVFTTWWFSVILVVFLLSLVQSAVDQFALARQRTFQQPYQPVPDAEIIETTEAHFEEVTARAGYRAVSTGNGGRRYVKHPWGYWGNFLFHVGLIVVIGSSLLLVCTESRGSLRMEEGRRATPAEPWSGREQGLLAEPLTLPADAALENVDLQFYETDELRQASSRLRFFYPDGPADSAISVNDPAWVGGMKIYQMQDAGHDFYLEITGPDRIPRIQGFQFLLPPKRDQASYNEFDLDWLPYHLKAKYFADAEKRSMTGSNPLLVLRMYDHDKLLGELALTPGQQGRIGSYEIRLLNVVRWAGVLFVRNTGMSGIFAGFFIIVMGGALIYFTPPREITAWSVNGSLRVEWKAGRFERLLRAEFDELMTPFRKEGLQ